MSVVDLGQYPARGREQAPGGRFGTPTVLVNGAKIDINDSGWLSNAISS